MITTLLLLRAFTWDDQLSSQGNVKQLVELARAYGRRCKSFVLTGDKDELLARNAARSYAVPRDEFEVLYENIYKTIGPDEIIVNSSGQAIEQTLSALRQVI